jgi:two-component system OmpR family response regulator
MQTIMIVEDDPDIRDGVRILLSGEGYRILEAENGPRALSLLTPEVDLVILDIMMPGMSGLRVCEEIRKTSTVPILFLTAKSQESDKLLGLTAGQALLLRGAERPGQGPAAPLLHLSG